LERAVDWAERLRRPGYGYGDLIFRQPPLTQRRLHVTLRERALSTSTVVAAAVSAAVGAWL